MKSKTAGFQRKAGSINAWRRTTDVPDLWQLFLDVVALAVLVVEGYRISQEDSPGFTSFALLTGGLAAVVVRRRLPALALVAMALLTVFPPLQPYSACQTICTARK